MLRHLLILFILSTYLTAYKTDTPPSPPSEAVEFQNELKELEANRLKEHQKLKKQGATPQQHQAIDDDALAKARKLEAKRTSALKKLGKKAGVGEIGQGKYGTEPTKGRGAFGDVDTSNFSGKDFEKIRAAAKKAGYTVTTDGDTMHIKELDTTVHREPSKYKSQTGSTAADADAAGGYGKETSRKLKTGDKTTEVLDNLGKSGNTLSKPTNKMSSSDWQEMGKMTGRNMDAAGIKNPDLRKKLDMLKQGYRPESVGIDDMDAFQKQCRDMNNKAAKKVRTNAKAKEINLKKKVTQAKQELKKAQDAGDIEKIKESSRKLKKNQSDLAEHTKTQKAAEDSLKKNQPKEAKKILDDTEPPKDLDEMMNRSKGGKKTPQDVDDMIKKPKTASDVDDMVGKQPKGTAPVGGKKNYMKVVKDGATGAVIAITFFSAAEDVKQKLKKGDIKGAGKLIVDNATGGLITITEQNVGKYNDFQEFKNKIDYANKKEFEAYVLRAGKALRENGVSADETNKIMQEMGNENFGSYKNKLAELKKEGKNISVAPPNLTARSWKSVFVDGDEGIVTRTADVFVAIGDGILAMPGKAKKFVTETGEEFYEILGPVKISKNQKGQYEIGLNGIFEKGVATELYNQKVESANNIYDIAKNEYNTYVVNKEIEEQKARKDKFAQKKEIRDKLVKQGIPFDKANDIAQKAAFEGDWSDFRKARQDLQAQAAAKEHASKMGVNDADFAKFANCMCQACGGTLGGSFCPECEGEYGVGPCRCSGPLTTWKTPLPTGKKESYECINKIVADHYKNDMKIFDQWHKRLRDENFKSAQKEVQEIRDHMSKGEFLQAADLFMAIESLIENYMVTKFYNGKAQGDNISYRLGGEITSGLLEQAKTMAENVTLPYPGKEINKRAAKAAKLQPNNQEIAKKVAKYESWEKEWHTFVSKDYNRIKKEIGSGQITTAINSLHVISDRLNKQVLPPRQKDPKVVELYDMFKQKEKDFYTARENFYNETARLKKVPDPRSVIVLAEKFLKTWEHHSINPNNMHFLGEARQNLRLAEENEKSGDNYAEQKKYPNAVDRYQVSLKLQKDAGVERKLNALLNRIKRAKEYRRKGDKALLENDTQAAVSKYKNSLNLVPDLELENLVKRLEGQLKAKEKKEQEIKRKIADLERKKRIESEMNAAGASFGDRFSGRESGRSQQVEERRSFDSYADSYDEEQPSSYDKMIGQLKKDLVKVQQISTSKKSSASQTQNSNKTFQTQNIGAVLNNPKKPTTFVFKSTCKLSTITNYHWNNAKGSTLGTIGLRDQSGKTFGPWSTTGSDGQGGVRNAYWTASPNITLSAGTYTIIDSEPSTWAHNSASGYRGMSDVKSDCNVFEPSQETTAAASSAADPVTHAPTVSDTPTVATPASTTAATTPSAATPAKFAGTMKGVWSGKNTRPDALVKGASGTFVMQVFNDGSVKITYNGDTEGYIGGSISTSGAVQTKKAGGDFEGLSWSGTIQKSSSGALSGSGSWVDSDSGLKGTWKSGTNTTSSTSKSTVKDSRDGTYSGYYRSKKGGKDCPNDEDVTLIIKGNQVSGDGSGTVDSDNKLSGSLKNGLHLDTSWVKFNDVIQGYLSGGKPGCSYYLELRKR